MKLYIIGAYFSRIYYHYFLIYRYKLKNKKILESNKYFRDIYFNVC